MSLDFKLINDNEISINQALVNIKKTPVDWVFEIENALTPDMLSKVVFEFENNNVWEKVELQADSSRQRIPWKPDSVIAEIHVAFDRISHRISTICQNTVKLASVDWWLDDESYTISPHLDNERIVAAVQIYVGESASSSGTELYVDNNIVHKIPWKSNCGYLLINTPNSYHGMTYPGSKRRSLYGIFK